MARCSLTAARGSLSWLMSGGRAAAAAPVMRAAAMGLGRRSNFIFSTAFSTSMEKSFTSAALPRTWLFTSSGHVLSRPRSLHSTSIVAALPSPSASPSASEKKAGGEEVVGNPQAAALNATQASPAPSEPLPSSTSTSTSTPTSTSTSPPPTPEAEAAGQGNGGKEEDDASAEIWKRAKEAAGMTYTLVLIMLGLWVVKVAASLIYMNVVPPMDEKEREQHVRLKVKRAPHPHPPAPQTETETPTA